MRVKRNFMDVGASTSSVQSKLMPKKDYDKVSTSTQELDPCILKSFLQTCMKLLRNQRVVEGLQELIDSCADNEVPRSNLHIINNLHRHKKRMGKEMR